MFTNYSNFWTSFCFLFFITITFAQPTPPNGKEWVKVEAMSDEFNNNHLDTTKWIVNDHWWEGRKPARFEESSVSVGGGNLKISASKKQNPYDGWTHNGGLVRSKEKNLYGYYETRMKANKTFMSSTFWLFNNKNEHPGCDNRDIELDITENIGINTGGQSWIDDNIYQIKSNTHSRNPTCSSTPIGQRGDGADIGGAAFAQYHTYGVWWKSATECNFYLDGQYVYQINPVSDFNLGMYLRMVIETFDYNPPKEGQDGMYDSLANRTTYYDYVRTYKLVNSSQLIQNGTYTINSTQSNQRLLARSQEWHSAVMTNPGSWDDQKWIFNHLGNNNYSIKNQSSGRYLEVSYGYCGDGYNVATWLEATAGHQQWKVETNNGDFTLRPLHCTSTALDRYQGALYANVQLSNFNKNNQSQNWSIQPLSGMKLSNSVEIDSEVSVYPNPVQNKLYVQNAKPNETIKIYNIVGKQVLSYSSKSNSNHLAEIDTSILSKGIYIVQVPGEELVKIVKQ